MHSRRFQPEEPKLSPAISEPGTEPSGSGAVTSTQPKYDVEGFLAHARSVMAGRCGSDVAKRDVALKNNISDFRNDAWKLLKGNLPENFHAAAGRELDECMDELKANGNRMGKGLKSPLKHKKYLVDLYKEFQMKETKIEEESSSVLAEPQKTYLYGLSIKLKALQEANDPAAANLIQTEIDNVGVIQNYFLRLMREAKMD